MKLAVAEQVALKTFWDCLPSATQSANIHLSSDFRGHGCGRNGRLGHELTKVAGLQVSDEVGCDDSPALGDIGTLVHV